MNSLRTFLLLGIGGLMGWFLHALVADKMPARAVDNTADVTAVAPAVSPIPEAALTREVGAKLASLPEVKQPSLQDNIIAALDNNEVAKALILLRQLQAEAPYVAETLMLSAKVYTQTKNYQAALEALQELYFQKQLVYPEELLRQQIQALLDEYLSQPYTPEQRTLRQDFLYQALRLLPDNLALRYTLGMLLVENNDFDAAVVQLNYLEAHTSWAQQATELKHEIELGKRFQHGALEVPLQHTQGGWRIEAYLDGEIPLRLLLDTGANLTVLKDAAIQQTDLNMAQAKPLILHTANGEVAAHRVLLEAFSVAAITNRQMPVAILPTHVLPPGIDGLLGTDWLGQFDFFIDQEKKILRLRRL